MSDKIASPNKWVSEQDMQTYDSTIDTPKLEVQPVTAQGVTQIDNQIRSRTDNRTTQETATDLTGKIKLNKPLVGESTISISKKGKLNLNKLAITPEGKSILEEINKDIPTSVIGNKEVVARARKAKVTLTHSPIRSHRSEA